ncbi:MAG: hypothetical protein ACI9O2_000502 [Flammeovirgaceae bacterium]|jgi:hypothetical protein
MKKFLIILCLAASSVCAQEPIQVVQAQLDAYNSQDINVFANLFAQDAKLYMNLGDTDPTMTGREEIRTRYGAMFKANPNNKSTLIGRMAQGNFVFDHEWITGRDKPIKIMAIYEVVDGLIVRCWFPR